MMMFIWVFPKIVVPPKHPKMIIFSRKTPWLLGTTIFGNTHLLPIYESWIISCPVSSFFEAATPCRDIPSTAVPREKAPVSKQWSGEKNNYSRKNTKKTVVSSFFQTSYFSSEILKTYEFDEIVHCHLQVYIIAIETMSARAKLSGELSPSAAWLDRSGFPGANCTAMLRRRQSC